MQINRAMFVGTGVGAFALRLREKIDLLRSIGRSPQNLAEMSNNVIARHLLESLCLPGKAFVDVGSHIGSVIDGVRRHSSPSLVVAVEAIPAKADALRRKFPEAVIHSCAVGDRDGEISFFIDMKQSGFSSLYPSRNADHLREIRVPMRRLDDLLKGMDVDVVKIDVEGAELAALRGAAAVLSKYAPTIMFESGPEEVGGLSKTDLWSFFDQSGYTILLPSRVAHTDPGLSPDGFADAHMFPRRTTNYFAVHRDRREEVRARARMIQGF